MAQTDRSLFGTGTILRTPAAAVVMCSPPKHCDIPKQQNLEPKLLCPNTNSGWCDQSASMGWGPLALFSPAPDYLADERLKLVSYLTLKKYLPQAPASGSERRQQVPARVCM